MKSAAEARHLLYDIVFLKDDTPVPVGTAQLVLETMMLHADDPEFAPVIQAWGCYAIVCICHRKDGLRQLTGAGAVYIVTEAMRGSGGDQRLAEAALRSLQSLTLSPSQMCGGTATDQALYSENLEAALQARTLDMVISTMMLHPDSHNVVCAALGVLNALVPNLHQTNRVLARAGMLAATIRELGRCNTTGSNSLHCLLLLHRMAPAYRRVVFHTDLLEHLHRLGHAHSCGVVRDSAFSLLRRLDAGHEQGFPSGSF
jgi:hypothetical protein